ncbi:histidine phosphatase family protein [Ensifer soli]|uniref:histidine phosphatase family protein n=1 Tax=Ciceribacter sp. sgz301302 TaxID=3342379 RepID=UPI0035BAD84D
MLIYLIRHGQTDWNAEGRLQGQKDIPLNDTGRAQATANGRALAKVLGGRVDAFDFVSSPLGRTRETMERLRAAIGLDPAAYRLDARLKEVSFGDWEGNTLAEIEARAPDLVAAREASKWDFVPPGETAESYEILSHRIRDWLDGVDRPTVCVCHGGVIRSMFKLSGHMASDEASVAPIPQDRILVSDNGALTWI